MKTRIFSAMIIASVAFVSCDKMSEGNNSSKKGVINFSKPQIASVMTKAISDKEVLVGSVESDDYSFSVTCQEDLITDGIATKGEIITARNLKSFAVHGFLDNEIDRMVGASDDDKKDHHFIKGAVASTSDFNTWSFVDEQKWRNGVNHTFWGYYPTSLDVNATPEKASFTYTQTDQTDFDTDILVSGAEAYYHAKAEAGTHVYDSGDDKLALYFYHALTAVTANTDKVKFYAKDKVGDGKSEDPKRGEISSAQLVNLSNSGVCSVGANGSITWSNLTKGVNVADTKFAKGLSFYIPQERSEPILYLNVKDTDTGATMPYTIYSLLGEGNWTEGTKYTYNIGGSITFPYHEYDPVPGIGADFEGNAFQFSSVFKGLDVKHIAKIRVTWTGIPVGNAGNGTFVYLSLEESGHDPVQTEYVGKNNPHVFFAYDLKQRSVIDGKGKVDQDTGKCSCEFVIPDGMLNPTMWAVYKGSNNSGTCAWHLRDLTVEVIGWR